MDALKDRHQLSFITDISLDAEQNFTQTRYFQSALRSLGALFDCDFIVVSNIIKDVNNHELLANNHVYSAHRANCWQRSFARLYSVEHMPAVYAKVAKADNEVTIAKADFYHDVFQNSDADILSNSSEQEFHCVPFISYGELVGIVSYQADEKFEFESLFPAAYRVLKSLFVTDYRMKKSAIEINTYQTVLDLMPQRVFWKNRQSVYLGCNKAFSTDASLECPEQIIGVTDFDIFPAQADLYRSDDANTMSTREHLINSEEPQTHKNGNTIWLRTSKRPIISEQDKVIGLVGTYDDITQLKNIQQELHTAKTELEDRVIERTSELRSSNQQLESAISELKTAQNQLVETEKMAALGGLVAGVAHEINTPIGIAVTGASHLEHMANQLKKGVAQGTFSRSKFNQNCDDLIHSSDLILRNLERASELIKNFKMIAVDQSNDEKRNIVLKQYLYDIVNAMTPKTNKNNVQIEVAGDARFTINTYPGTIAQLITNLIDNALEHAFINEQHGNILIKFALENERVEMVFEDDGEGISPDLATKIFEPFYTTKRGAGGSGLGLSIVYNLVTQRLNGNITCDSLPQHWTRFIISFPVN